jgi:hypothetical protein
VGSRAQSNSSGKPVLLTFGGLLALALVFANADSARAAGSVQPTVGLGTADSFEVLGATTVTNTGPTTVTNGDVGLSPGTAVVGFPPGVIANGVIHATDAQALQAQADLTTAYNDAAGRTPDTTGIIDLAGQTFTPGVHAGGALALNGTVTLSGGANSVFIFQAASTLITGSSSVVAFSGGASACNVFWQVGSSATLGTNTTFAGTIMALTSITANTGATIDGRLLARNGAVTLDTNVLTRPASCAPRAGVVPSSPTPAQIAAAAAAAAAQAAAAQAAAEAAAAAAAAAAQAAASGGTARALAATGSDVVPLASAAAISIAAGLALAYVVQRRRRVRTPKS